MHDLAEAPASPRPGGPLEMHDAIFSQHYVQGNGYRIERPHGTTTWLLIYTVRGRGYFRAARGGHETARPQDVHLYPPAVFAEYGSALRHGWDFHWVHFLPRPTWASLLALPPVERVPGLRCARVASAPTARRVVAMFEDLHRDSMVAGPVGQELAFNALERILLLVAAGTPPRVGRSRDPRIQRVLETIALSPGGKFTLAGLARGVGLSVSRLAHLFKEATGRSVFETVIGARLKEAAKLLRAGGATVQDAARRAGFNSPFYFSRQFARTYGLPPSEYRARSLRLRLTARGRRMP